MTDPRDDPASETQRLSLPGMESQPAQQEASDGKGSDAQRTDAESFSALDAPLDGGDLRSQLRRRRMARSTRILLFVLGGIVIFALGAMAGRSLVPSTGPGSAPPVVGTIETVVPMDGSVLLNVRSEDGTLTAIRTSAGTTVAVPRPGGARSLRAGQQVTVSSERGTDGALTATRVDLPSGS